MGIMKILHQNVNVYFTLSALNVIDNLMSPFN